MYLASSYRPFAAGDRATARRRAAGLAFALVAHVLLLLLLLTLAPPQSPLARVGPRIFRLLPISEGTNAPTPTKRAVRQEASRRGERKAAATAPARAAPPKPAPVPALNMIHVAHDVFAAGDIGGIAPAAPSAATAGAGEADGAETAAAGGGGPGGERLYDADWYTRPTRAELSTYLPASAPPEAWGEIACRTAARFRVEDCRALAESPAGSRMAQAVLNASWQFKVLPPRIGGRAMIGAWVRIRITLQDAPTG